VLCWGWCRCGTLWWRFVVLARWFVISAGRYEWWFFHFDGRDDSILDLVANAFPDWRARGTTCNVSIGVGECVTQW